MATPASGGASGGVSGSGDDGAGGFVAVCGFAGVFVAGMWCARELCAVATGGRAPVGSRPVGLVAGSWRVLRDPVHPVAAFGGRADAPAWLNVMFWITAVLVWVSALIVAAVMWRLWVGERRVGQRRSAQFGAPAWSRAATRRDVRPMVVRGPVPGRTILGTCRGRLVATEDRFQPVRRSKRRPHPRQGDRGAILGVGPARSGKSQVAISAILEHDWSPAICSSVKTDLIAATIRRRVQLGDVAIFDPLHMTSPAAVDEMLRAVRERAARRGEVLGALRWVGWSPITVSRSVSGAQQMARRLVEAAPMDDSVNDRSYWQSQAERLVWPMLHAAALGGQDMADVVRWVVLGDQPARDPSNTSTRRKEVPVSDVGRILTEWSAKPDRQVADGARVAHETLQGIWALPADTRGGIYSSAQTLLTPWEDPVAARNAALAQRVDLEWLFGGSGRNTLYVVMPANAQDSKRFAVIFGGLLGELTDQVFETVNRTGRPVDDLLLVLDEAGNSPCEWLPSVATTCASNGMTLITLWQSLAQIESAFGRRTDTLLTNHVTKIFFGGTSDQATLETAARLAGEHEVLTRSMTDGSASARGPKQSLTLNTTATGLLGGALVRQIPAGQALCIHGTLPPIHLRTRRYWQDRGLRARHDGTADVPSPRSGLLSQLGPLHTAKDVVRP